MSKPKCSRYVVLILKVHVYCYWWFQTLTLFCNKKLIQVCRVNIFLICCTVSCIHYNFTFHNTDMVKRLLLKNKLFMSILNNVMIFHLKSQITANQRRQAPVHVSDNISNMCRVKLRRGVLQDLCACRYRSTW